MVYGAVTWSESHWQQRCQPKLARPCAAAARRCLPRLCRLGLCISGLIGQLTHTIPPCSIRVRHRAEPRRGLWSGRQCELQPVAACRAGQALAAGGSRPLPALPAELTATHRCHCAGRGQRLCSLRGSQGPHNETSVVSSMCVEPPPAPCMPWWPLCCAAPAAKLAWQCIKQHVAQPLRSGHSYRAVALSLPAPSASTPSEPTRAPPVLPNPPRSHI